MEKTLFDDDDTPGIEHGKIPNGPGISYFHTDLEGNRRRVTGRELVFTTTWDGKERAFTVRPGITASYAIETAGNQTIGLGEGVAIHIAPIKRLKKLENHQIDRKKVSDIKSILEPSIKELRNIQDKEELQKKLEFTFFKLGTICVSIEGYIIDGLHRWMAFKELNLPGISCIIVNVLKEEESDVFNKLVSVVNSYREQAKKETEARLLELEKNKSSKLFRNKSVTGVASASPVSGASEVLAKGVLNLPNYQKDHEGRYFYPAANQTRIYINTLNTKDIYEAITAESLSTILESFSLEAACLNLLYAAKAADLPDPTKPFIYTYEDICEDLGLDKKKQSSKDKRANILNWGQQPGQLSCLVPNLDKKWLEQHKTWDISPIYHDDGKVSFKIRAGMWAEYYLEPNPDKRKSEMKTRQITHISKEVLSSITKASQTRPGAARIMLWLLFKHRQDSANYSPVTIKTCMVHAYGEQEVISASQDKNRAKNLFEKWSNDLLWLNDNKWKIDSKEWPDNLKPDWMLEKSIDGRRPKNYFQTLLELKTIIYPPADIEAELEKLKVQKAKPVKILQETSKKLTDIPKQMKSNRDTKGLSQAQAAEILGISTVYYKKIEQGSKKPSSELEAKIQNWLKWKGIPKGY